MKLSSIHPRWIRESLALAVGLDGLRSPKQNDPSRMSGLRLRRRLCMASCAQLGRPAFRP